MDLHSIIKRPLVTEKGTVVRELHNQYVFEVAPVASKTQIRAAIEQLFKVHVENVRTINIRGKYKRVGQLYGQRSNWKKVYVTLREGEKLELFEGV